MVSSLSSLGESSLVFAFSFGVFGLVKTFGFKAPLWLVKAFALALDFAFDGGLFVD
jgi:hypothetical protein